VLFTDPLFLVFLSLAVLVNFTVHRNKKLHRIYILFISFAFFCLSSPSAFVLFLICIILNYPTLWWVANAENRLIAALVLATTVSINLLILGYFKYASFLAENISPGFILPFGGWAPLAISFYTFHIISYAIDLYERKYPISRPLDYAAYLSFFPHLIAGPIVRGNQLLPQLEQPIPQHLFDWREGPAHSRSGSFSKWSPTRSPAQ
jgi:alginate O-acetyltransferase complex protein AlgI